MKISKLDNGHSIRFLDMFENFISEWGVVKPELYLNDKLHISTAGYSTWASTMDNLLNEMLNQDNTVDDGIHIKPI